VSVPVGDGAPPAAASTTLPSRPAFNRSTSAANVSCPSIDHPPISSRTALRRT